jgi:hypothetical protein
MSKTFKNSQKLAFAAVLITCVGLASYGGAHGNKRDHMPAVCAGLTHADLSDMNKNIKIIEKGEFSDYLAQVQEDDRFSVSKKVKLLKCYKARLQAKGLGSKY